MRGDEPFSGLSFLTAVVVCPTRVGMNRIPCLHRIENLCLPHMRGDEPFYIQTKL